MKAFLEYVHYDGLLTHRGRIPLPDVTPEEFDWGTHCATVFQCPVSDVPVNPMLYVWKTCQPIDELEEVLLIAMGKMSVSAGSLQKPPTTLL